MNQNKLSSRITTLIKSAIAAAVLPVLFIYIMIAKPDYTIMRAMGHVVVPVFSVMGDIITWPVRAVGNLAENIHELSTLRDENEELRAKLDAALTDKNMCDVAIAENQKLARELDLVQSQPYESVLADVQYDNRAFGHRTFLINRGSARGIEPGMAVVSTDGVLAGIVIDAGVNFARVRALTDADTNIAVRVVGSEVYGFLTGNGTSTATMGFFSDPQFQPDAGVKLVTSNISGVLPGGIIIGTMTNDKDVKVLHPGKLSRVMVLKFDAVDKYK
ncbi:MAG: rod shape-determining protein MreC [Alphaproteobacteria bacterium]|nr:rod shape-determining protein MreC [Alphaproteobacteria bacterium]